MNSNLNEKYKHIVPHVHVNLPKPKVLANTNDSENIRIAKEKADIIAELYYGLEVNPSDMKSKTQFTLETCKDLVSFYDWAAADKRKEDADAANHGPVNPTANDMTM